jgi:hypothetical protein
MLGEALPDPAVISLDWRAVVGRHAEIFEREALSVEHAEDVMVGDDEQLGRRAQVRGRVGQQRRWDVAVRADQRQIFDRGVQRARSGAGPGRRRSSGRATTPTECLASACSFQAAAFCGSSLAGAGRPSSALIIRSAAAAGVILLVLMTMS